MTGSITRKAHKWWVVVIGSGLALSPVHNHWLTKLATNQKGETLFFLPAFGYLLLIMGAFGAVVAGLLATPTVPIGFIILTLAGVLAGQMTYRWRVDLLMTTVVTVLIALVGIWLGTLPFAASIVGWINSLAGDANGVLYGTPYGPMLWSVWLWGIFALFFCYLG